MTSEARAFRGEPTVAVLLDERAPPGLYALMHLPKRRLQLDGECFTYAGLGDWIGFYDWLRTVAGEVIGVRLWPDEGGASVKALAGHVGVDRAADGGAVCIFSVHSGRLTRCCRTTRILAATGSSKARSVAS